MLVTLGILGVPTRLSGEPTTSTTTPTPASLLFGGGASPNPLRLYPHRPGAKYEDVEARPKAAVNLGLTQLRIVGWTVEPHTALPRRFVPAEIARYEDLGLADGYSPVATSTPGDLLHVRIQVSANAVGLPTAISCIATVGDDGSTLLPYQRPPPPPPSTTPALPSPTSPRVPINRNLYFPIGARRGRIYLTCRDSYNDALFGTDRRAVWAIHV